MMSDDSEKANVKSEKNLYRVRHEDLWWDIIVMIETPKADEAIKMMVEFWMDWEDRLRFNDFNYTKTFLQQFALAALHEQISNAWNKKGLISAFENKEGWCPMGGTHGIKIIKVDSYPLQEEDFEIKLIDENTEEV